MYDKNRILHLVTITGIIIIIVTFIMRITSVAFIINNGNMTEWSPIRSVIIRVIDKIGQPRSGSPIC